MFFAQNVKLLRKRKKRSQDDVATSLNIKRSSISSYELGTSEPSLDTLIKLSEYYRIGIDKLLKVDLQRLSESILSEMEKGHDIDVSGNRLRILATTVNQKNKDNVELVPIKAKAGYTAGLTDPEYIKELPVFNLPFLDKNKKYRTFPISGDSMPPVSNGSWLTAEYVQDWTTIKDNQPYIIITKDEGIVFKIILNRISERKTLLLCSTNPVYKPYEVNINEILEVWKFTNFISPELSEPNLSKEEMTSTLLNLQREVGELKAKNK